MLLPPEVVFVVVGDDKIVVAGDADVVSWRRRRRRRRWRRKRCETRDVKSERRGGDIASGGSGAAADIDGDGSYGSGSQRVEGRQRVFADSVAEALTTKLLERRVRGRAVRLLLLLRLAPADVGEVVVGTASHRMPGKTQGIVERRRNLRRVQRVDESPTASTKTQGYSGKGVLGSDAASKKSGATMNERRGGKKKTQPDEPLMGR